MTKQIIPLGNISKDILEDIMKLKKGKKIKKLSDFSKLENNSYVFACYPKKGDKVYKSAFVFSLLYMFKVIKNIKKGIRIRTISVYGYQVGPSEFMMKTLSINKLNIEGCSFYSVNDKFIKSINNLVLVSSIIEQNIKNKK